MKDRSADPEFPPMQEDEINELLNQPIYLRMAMINERDGAPLVHPIWYDHEDGKFYAVSNSSGTENPFAEEKSRSLFSSGHC